MLLRQLSVRRPCNMIYVLVKGISSWLDVWGLLLRTTLGYVWRRRCRGSSRLTWRMQITHRPRCSPSELPSRFRDIYLDTEMQLIGSLERACRLRLRSPRWIKYQLGSGWKVGCVREPEGPRVACRRVLSYAIESFYSYKSVLLLLRRKFQNQKATLQNRRLDISTGKFEAIKQNSWNSGTFIPTFIKVFG